MTVYFDKTSSKILTYGTTKLADLLRANNLSYAEVIAAIGIGSRTLTRYCNEPNTKIRPQYLAKLSDLLDCDPDEIQ